MQTRSRTAAASLPGITKISKIRNKSSGRIHKTMKRTIATTATVAGQLADEGHPLEEKPEHKTTPEPNSDPTLATLTSPASHRLIHIPHTNLHATFLTGAMAHLISVDARFKDIFDKNHCHMFSPEGLAEGVDPFKSLVRGILSQQVSGAAARSITRKFILLFTSPVDEEGNPPSGYFPTPQAVITKKPEVLRTAGLSGRKAEYVLDLSQRFTDGRLKAEDMVHDSDEEIIRKLVEVRGIGAEMFLMFALKRPDVLSTGDLGIQRGMAAWTGKNIANAKGKSGKWKYMSENEMLSEGEKWRPYRSVASWCMWRFEGRNCAPQ